LIRSEGEANHYCPNYLHCPPQITGRIIHFVSRKALNIDGLGEETIELLYSESLIRTVADLYDLKQEQLSSLERMGDKSAANILSGLQKSLDAPYHKKLFALGIRHVGETVAKTLAAGFNEIDKLMSASEEELTALPEVGPKIALSVTEYFNDPENREIIRRLREAGMGFSGPAVSSVRGILTGKTIVISGTFMNHLREEIKALIEAHGGKAGTSVSGNTSFLLAGSDMGPAKRARAAKKGVPVITEEEFMKMIKEY